MGKPLKNEIIYDGPLTGTIDNDEANGSMKYDPIQQTWRVHPADEADYQGNIGYKDA